MSGCGNLKARRLGSTGLAGGGGEDCLSQLPPEVMTPAVNHGVWFWREIVLSSLLIYFGSAPLAYF